MVCGDSMGARGKKIVKIEVPHKEEYKSGNKKITEGVTIIKYKDEPSTIVNWKEVIEGDVNSNAEITYIIQYDGKKTTQHFKTKYLDTMDGKRLVHVDGINLSGSNQVSRINKDVALSEMASGLFSVECIICEALVTVLCSLLADGVAEAVACEEAPSLVCIPFLFYPVVYAVCYPVVATICFATLETIVELGVGTACALGGSYVCSKTGAC